MSMDEIGWDKRKYPKATRANDVESEKKRMDELLRSPAKVKLFDRCERNPHVEKLKVTGRGIAISFRGVGPELANALVALVEKAQDHPDGTYADFGTEGK